MAKTPTPAATPTPVIVTEPTELQLAQQKKAELEAAAPANAERAADKADPMVALNLIVHIGDDGKPEDVSPGTVFRPAKADLPFLTSQDAVREPTESELLMFEHVEKLQQAAPADDSDALG